MRPAPSSQEVALQAPPLTNVDNFIQNRLLQVLFNLDSKEANVLCKLYFGSTQSHLASLSAIQKVCAKRAP
jgi:hypothetical protein